MEIQNGLFDRMVLQRTPRNVSRAAFCGTSCAVGSVVATVKKGRSTLKGFSRRKVGVADDGVVQGAITGVPIGGPYDITLEVLGAGAKALDKATVRDVLVGDVWILAGQSNMEGIGFMKHALKAHAMTRAFYMDDHWGAARDPLHELSVAVDEVHTIISGGKPGAKAPHIGVGPGVAFGQQMHRVTKVPQGLIACAHGGTSMAQWSPSLRGQGGKSLYGAMLRRARTNGGSVAGVFWYQGCSDTDAAQAPLYTDRMKELVGSLRSDLGDSRLPWVIVQIASVCGEIGDARNWNSIQEQERLLPTQIKRLAAVPAIDLALDDLIHLSGDSQNRLGIRAAQAMAVLTGRTTRGKPPIALKSVKVEQNKQSGAGDVVVTFDNVDGVLAAKGRPWGFELTARPGELQNTLVHRIDLDGARAVLRTIASPADIQSTFLYYGFGRRPYCNVTDSADRSLPVLGPVYLGGRTAFGAFVTRLRVSRFMPSADKLHSLAYPADKASLELRTRQFEGTFCSLHPEISSSGMADLLVYFAARVHCGEPMDVEVWLGYDGPVKLWIDGAERLFDPTGVNPALPADSCTPVHFETGEHEVLVALGSNSLKAWGIFLRLGRAGIDPRSLMQGPGGCVLPEVVG